MARQVECHQQGTFSSRPFLFHASWQSLGLPGGREGSVQGTQRALLPPSDVPQAQSRGLHPTSTSAVHPPVTPLKPTSHLSRPPPNDSPQALPPQPPPPLALRSPCISPPRPWGADQKQQVSPPAQPREGSQLSETPSPGGLWARAGVCSLRDLTLMV